MNPRGIKMNKTAIILVYGLVCAILGATSFAFFRFGGIIAGAVIAFGAYYISKKIDEDIPKRNKDE